MSPFISIAASRLCLTSGLGVPTVMRSKHLRDEGETRREMEPGDGDGDEGRYEMLPSPESQALILDSQA